MRKLKLDELNRPLLEEYKVIEKIPVIIVLDNIRSALNIGSVFRTADAFLIEKIYLCGVSAKPPHKDINKSALGSINSVCWEYSSHTLTTILALKKEGYKIISIEQVENSIKSNEIIINSSDKYVLIFGNEVDGVSQEVINNSDCCLEVAQFGTKHSLNISVCAGIIIYLFFNKIKNPT
jgi:tRNA G18 (ribose-2'-O)-methylase SpoU